MFVAVSRCVFACLALLVFCGNSQAHKPQRLYEFNGNPDGAGPIGDLVADPAGNLYGVTLWGGGSSACGIGGCGAVFEVTPQGRETLLYGFDNTDGSGPMGGLALDKEGNLYGTTSGGGRGHDGVVFELARNGTETVLHSFTGKDGAYPEASLLLGPKGTLYGTTYSGGIPGDCAGLGCGTVFKLKPDGTEKVLYAFKGGEDGSYPSAGLVKDKSGNLYGTTVQGGGPSCQGAGCGTVYKLSPDGTEFILHSFAGGSDGAYPQTNLVMDSDGNLYGATPNGGGFGCNGNGCGIIFKVSPRGRETVVYRFEGAEDGRSPSGLTIDLAGNLYGASHLFPRKQTSSRIFMLTPNGSETNIGTLRPIDGDYSSASGGALLLRRGKLYGTGWISSPWLKGAVFFMKKGSAD